MKIVNVAKRPFENLRPVRRIAAILWTLGGVLTLLNLWLFWDHLTGFSATSDQLADVREKTEQETERIETLGQEVAALALDEQNDEVAVLNQLIADRTFPWGLLFDRLEAVLPDQVWLQSVRPERQEVFEGKATRRRSSARRGRRRAEPSEAGVGLALNGQAKSTEDLYTLVDRLFADPTFDRPSLHSLSTQRDTVNFNLDVIFLVDRAFALAEEPADEVEDLRAGTDVPSTDATVAERGDEESPRTVDGSRSGPSAVASAVGASVEPPAAESADRSLATPPSTVAPPVPDRRDNAVPTTRSARDRLSRQRTTPRASPAPRSGIDREVDAEDTPAEGTPPIDPIAAGGVPIIMAPPAAATRTPTAPVPATVAPQASAQDGGPSTRPARPGTSAPPRPPGTTRPSPPAGGGDDAPPPPPRLTAEDLEPLPPSPPASSSARIGGRR